MTKITNLEARLRDTQVCPSDEAITERERLKEESESTKQCLAICAEACEHIREFENKLQVDSSPHISDKAVTERGRIQEEKESTEKCLTICTKALEHISQFQSNLPEEFSSDIISIPGGLTSSKRATANTLQECENILTNITVELEERIRKINSILQTLFVQGEGMLFEDATIRTNVFEDVSTAQDSHQVIMSPRNLTSATRVAAGVESRQWPSQMFGGTLQRLLYDISRATQQTGDAQEGSSGIMSETQEMGTKYSRES